MTVGLVVEPIVCEIDVIIAGGKSYHPVEGKYLDNTGEKPILRDELLTEIRRLVEVEKLSIKAVSEKCKLSLTTVKKWREMARQNDLADSGIQSDRQ